MRGSTCFVLWVAIWPCQFLQKTVHVPWKLVCHGLHGWSWKNISPFPTWNFSKWKSTKSLLEIFPIASVAEALPTISDMSGKTAPKAWSKSFQDSPGKCLNQKCIHQTSVELHLATGFSQSLQKLLIRLLCIVDVSALWGNNSNWPVACPTRVPNAVYSASWGLHSLRHRSQ